MSLFPAPTTNLDSLHDLVSQLEAVSQRWLDDARVKPEPPTTTDISNMSISVRRITLIHRDIYRLENPGLAFPASKKSSPTHTQADEPFDFSNASDTVDPNDPDILSKNSSSTPLTYSREISRYVAARIVASIKSKPEDAADCCPHLYEEMDLMKSNPAYHAETLADMSASPAPANSPDPVDPEILSKKSASENSVNSVALCENSSSSPVDPPDPVILSNSKSSPTHTPTQAAPASPVQPKPNSPSTHSPSNVAPAPSPVHSSNSDSNFHSSNFTLHTSSNPVDPPDPVILSKNSSSPARAGPTSIRRVQK